MVGAAAVAVLIAGFGTIATGVNFIATVHTLRAPGLTWFRLPLFVWSIYATSLVMILATPVLAMTLLLIAAERWFGLPIFDANHGGDPAAVPASLLVLFASRRLHHDPAGDGRRSPRSSPAFPRRRVFGYASMVYAMLGIAVIGFGVWGHHMFVSGQSPFANLVFSFLSFIVAVPSAIKTFNWIATLYRGQITFEAPMIYALGFVGLFTIGGLTGLFLASVPIDVHVTGTYFVDRAFPLHHGRRRGIGLFRRPASMVAEDHRRSCTRNPGRASRPC